ncbi:MAG: hypothetical protein IJ578_05610 [Bacteroidales bacterium]|nr:hypothetical protein [Bacteroidales bacterium]
MKIYRIFLTAAAAFLAMGLVSCKKDKSSEETKEYLTGTMSFTIPTYVMPGQQFHLVPSGVTKSDGSTPGIYWTDSVSSVRDTTRLENGSGDGSIDFTVPEDVTSMTLSCYAFAEGYYNSSKIVSLVIVKGAESISGLDLPDDVAMLEDARDNRSYPYVKIGGREWMARNLAYGSGKPYYNAAAMQDVFGMYYTWDEAVAACPEGWRLPDAADWDDLAKAHGCETPGDVYAGIAGAMMADAYMNENKMWEFWPEVTISNQLKFCAIPSGYAMEDGENASFRGSSHYAVFWTAEEAEEGQAWVRQLYVQNPDVFKSSVYKSYFRANVRCVRDAGE